MCWWGWWFTIPLELLSDQTIPQMYLLPQKLLRKVHPSGTLFLGNLTTLQEHSFDNCILQKPPWDLDLDPPLGKFSLDHFASEACPHLFWMTFPSRSLSLGNSALLDRFPKDFRNKGLINLLIKKTLNYNFFFWFQTYVADIFLAQSWRDPRLRLPENMHEEYRILDVDWLNKIWRPDCFFKNAKKVTFHEMSIPNHYLWLYHDKTLLYMSK